MVGEGASVTFDCGAFLCCFNHDGIEEALGLVPLPVIAGKLLHEVGCAPALRHPLPLAFECIVIYWLGGLTRDLEGLGLGEQLFAARAPIEVHVVVLATVGLRDSERLDLLDDLDVNSSLVHVADKLILALLHLLELKFGDAVGHVGDDVRVNVTERDLAVVNDLAEVAGEVELPHSLVHPAQLQEEGSDHDVEAVFRSYLVHLLVELPLHLFLGSHRLLVFHSAN
mmetsp:Transcript_11563/g.17444  ORF Transcript_11563/g.17444 Transcript_11563/m.17444 type:complete len:226 (+) Transcript_11563:1974-2651(+)